MYFIFSFEVNLQNPKAQIEETFSVINNALSTFEERVQPLANTVLVKCDSLSERKEFLTIIRAYTDANKERMSFLVTPLISINKGFNGFIKKDFHEKITEITTNQGLNQEGF